MYVQHPAGAIIDIMHNIMLSARTYALSVVCLGTLIKIIQKERMTELQYHDVSTYLRAWYKGKKNDSPIELGSDLGQVNPNPWRPTQSKALNVLEL